MKFPDNIPLPIPYGWYHISFSDELAAGQNKPVFYFNRAMLLSRNPASWSCQQLMVPVAGQ
jgi:hypothetical protein